jgi:ribosomal protein L29
MITKNNKNKDIAKLKDELINLRKNLMNFNFQKSSGQLENTAQIRKTKKEIARLKTKMVNFMGEKNA